MHDLAQWLGKPRVSVILFLVGILAACLYTLNPATAHATLSNQSKVAIDGIGPVRVGMTLQEAVNSANTPFTLKPGAGAGNNCGFANPVTGPPGLGFMVTEGRIARVDVFSNQQITTLSGAKIGDSESQIKALYPERLTVTAHPYVRKGHYLTFVPKDAADQKYRLIFETNGQKVTQFRAGLLPEVNFIEGCA